MGLCNEANATDVTTPVDASDTVAPDLKTNVVSNDNVSGVDTTPSPIDAVKILDGVRLLCNDTLYVLYHATFRGQDAHLVARATEFIKEIKADVERKAKDAVVASNGPVVVDGNK